MVREWTNAADPTPLQYNVNKMFGKDLTEMLSKVQMDLFIIFRTYEIMILLIKKGDIVLIHKTEDLFIWIKGV